MLHNKMFVNQRNDISDNLHKGGTDSKHVVNTELAVLSTWKRSVC